MGAPIGRGHRTGTGAAVAAPPIVVHVAAEVSPFHKTGGLGDVMGGLPPALARAGLDVRVVTGHFGGATDFGSIGGWDALRPWPVPLDVSIGGQRIDARVLEARTHGGLVTTYFVDAPHLSRGGIYGFGDDPFRFAILSRASVAIAGVLARAKRLGPVVALHAHDWHAALAVYFARALASSARAVPTVFTIHNLAFQGECEASSAPYLGVGWEAYHEFFENRGTLNMMKGAILLADRVTTVSPTYAREICTPQYGQGLDGLLRHVGGKLVGIVNGIDTRAWDPATDTALAANFSGESAQTVEARDACREALRWELGLAGHPDGEAPVVGVVSRLTQQKGMDHVCDVADAWVRGGGQFAILGEGDVALEHRLHWLALAHPGAIAYRRAFDDGLARRIYAGSDLFAMPSRFEPCGLAQMYAMRYGAIPVARATGGLVDTIAPLHDRHDVGGATGILYPDETAPAFLAALSRGRELVRDTRARTQIRSNAMSVDHSWDRVSREYMQMYARDAPAIASPAHNG